MNIFKVLKEYKEIDDYYKNYLKTNNVVIYNFSPYVDLDFSKQKALQPLKKQIIFDVKYCVSFNNVVYRIEQKPRFEEAYSYLDPNLNLFNNNEQEYKKYLKQEQIKKNERNRFLYNLLNKKIFFEEYNGNLKLRQTIFTSLTFKKYKAQFTVYDYYFFEPFSPILDKELQIQNE